MECPNCKASHRSLHVPDSRHIGKDTVRRRRECLKCKTRFSTMEVIIEGGTSMTNARVILTPRGCTLAILPKGTKIRVHDDD